MTCDGSYGTRADHLPRSMVKVARAGQQSGRLLTWVGRSGVELLELGEHLQYEHQSLRRYPQGSDGAIDWNAVPGGLVLMSIESDSIDLSAVIRRSAPGAGDLVFLWGSSVVPSVRMEMEVALSHLTVIIETEPEFWIYSPSDQVLLEHSFSGVVTVARVPADETT